MGIVGGIKSAIKRYTEFVPSRQEPAQLSSDVQLIYAIPSLSKSPVVHASESWPARFQHAAGRFADAADAWRGKRYADVGARYREARKLFDQEIKDRSIVPGIPQALMDPYLDAVRGEVVWSTEIDSGTLTAIDRFKRELDPKNKPAHVEAKWTEKFMRSVALLRLGRHHRAEHVIAKLDGALLSSHEPSPSLRTNVFKVHVAAASIYFEAGKKSAGKKRERYFGATLRHLLRAEEAAAQLAAGRELDAPHEHLGEIDPGLYKFFAEFRYEFAEKLMESSYTAMCHVVICDLVSYYPNSTFAQAAVSEHGRFTKLLVNERGIIRFVTEAELKERAKGWPGFKAAAKEFIRRAKFPSRKAYFAHAAPAAMIGIGVAAGIDMAVSSMTGKPFSFDVPTAAAASGFGAVAGTVYGKVKYARNSPEYRQVKETGVTPLAGADTALDVAKEVGKLGATYVGFGGVVPGAAALKDVPVARHLVYNAGESAAQLHGAGDITGYVGNSIVQHGYHMYQADSLSAYWKDAKKWSALVATLDNDYKLWIKKFVPYMSTKAVGEAAKGIYNVYAHGTAWEKFFFTYKALVGAYYAHDLLNRRFDVQARARFWNAVMRGVVSPTKLIPGLNERVKSKLPGMWLPELLFLPAAWSLGVDISTACGVKPFDASIIAAMGLVQQGIFHFAGGGSVGNMDLANTGRNAALLGMYAGLGNQMLPTHGFNAFSDYVGKSIGIQVGFIPIMIADWYLIRQNGRRVFGNKLARGVTIEQVSNGFAIWLGFATWYGTLIKELIGNLVNHGWMSRTYNTFTASPQQEKGMFGAIDRGDPRRFMDDFRVAMRRWPFGAPLNGKGLEHIAPFMAFWYSAGKFREPFETKPDDEFLVTMHNMVERLERSKIMENGGEVDELRNYLNAVEHNLRNADPRDSDALTGMLLSTYARRNGAHSEEIRNFIDRNPQIFDYGIPEDLPDVPEEPREQRRFFQTHMDAALQTVPPAAAASMNPAMMGGTPVR